jgi:hypothetical protein
MKVFLTFPRRPWYTKKRFVIPLSVLIILAIVGAIVGIVMGLKTANSENTGKFSSVNSLLFA